VNQIKLLNANYQKETPEAVDVLIEQNEYLRGVLYSDVKHRLDMNYDRDIAQEIDPYGTSTRHFWRGVVETVGRIGMQGLNQREIDMGLQGAGYTYPRFELRGSYRFLRMFLDHIEENVAVAGMSFDDTGKLNFACGGNILRLSGYKAQDVVKHLYQDHTVSRESVRTIVDVVLTWTGKK